MINGTTFATPRDWSRAQTKLAENGQIRSLHKNPKSISIKTILRQNLSFSKHQNKYFFFLDCYVVLYLKHHLAVWRQTTVSYFSKKNLSLDGTVNHFFTTRREAEEVEVEEDESWMLYTFIWSEQLDQTFSEEPLVPQSVSSAPSAQSLVPSQSCSKRMQAPSDMQSSSPSGHFSGLDSVSGAVSVRTLSTSASPPVNQ